MNQDERETLLQKLAEVNSKLHSTELQLSAANKKLNEYGTNRGYGRYATASGFDEDMVEEEAMEAPDPMPEPAMVILEVEPNMYTMSGFPAFLHSSRMFSS